jgi:RNA polymerase sigma-70 factor, ECF subfamily
MNAASDAAVRAGLSSSLVALWRYALVLSRNRDEADDLVQATCLRALERSHQFMPGTRVERWLFTILRSIWLNELRSRRYRDGGGGDPEIASAFDGAAAAETNILLTQVLKDVEALPEAQRETLFLVYVEGHSYAEAAALLDVPIGTVMSRLAAARLKLATASGRRPDRPVASGER